MRPHPLTGSPSGTLTSPLTRLAVVALVSLCLGLFGCGDSTGGNGDGGNGGGNGSGDGAGGGPGGGGGIIVGTLPEVELDPNDLDRVIVEAALEVGEFVEETVGIINTGDGVLTVRGYELEYTPTAGGDDGDHPAFELLNAFDTEIEVHPQGGETFPQRAEIRVRFTRKEDGLPRAATLRIETDDPDEDEILVNFSTESGLPRLNATPGEIDFALVAQGETGEKELTLLNVGSKTLLVSGFQVTNYRFGVKGDGFDIGGILGGPTSVDLPEAIPVGAGSTKGITVTFFSDSAQPAEGNLIIFSNDPDTGVSGLLVPLSANKNGPCIEVDPRSVSFGGKLVGQLAEIEVEISSCGTEPLSITGLRLTDDSSTDFALDEDAILALNEDQVVTELTPLIVPVNDFVKVPIQFVPDEINPKDADNVPIPDEGTFIIESNAFEAYIEVPVVGAGAEEDCPVAVIQIEEGEEVIPQTVLHLDGTGSYAPFGQIESWTWTVEQPDGNQQLFIPSPTAPDPVFYANTVGIYTFTLEVRDENNTKSCQPDVRQVVVQPDQAIHVELTWQTPGDEDETDDGVAAGTDVDLHFTHPNATGPDYDDNDVPDPWFDDQWDCFWYNGQPNWGSFDPEAGDDPSLDRDDTNGAGPENLNISIPEDGALYHIGVHFWADHGFGPVKAAVKVFTYATEIYAEGDVDLEEKDMWCVGAVNWPEPEVSSCEPKVPDGIVSDYVNPFFLSF